MPGATILLASELGTGLGHAEKLLVLARALCERGHRPVFALREPIEAHALLAGAFPLVPAPHLPVVRARAGDLPASMAGVLSAFGLDRAETIAAALAVWRTLLDALQPALVVADYAPLLCLAAAPVPALVVGSGFCLPPPEQPRFLPLVAHGEAAATDARVLAAFRAALGPAAPPTLPALFAGSAHAVLCLPELDPYSAVRASPVAGPLTGLAHELAHDGSADLFAYLAGEDPFTAVVLAGLHQAGARALVYVRDRHRVEPAATGGRVEYLAAPLPFARAAARARLVVHHGGLGTAQKALLAGRAQLLAPRHFEQKLTADAIARLGVGLTVGRRAGPERIAGLVAELLAPGDATAARAATFGAELRGRHPTGCLAAVVATAERLLHGRAALGRALAEHPAQRSPVEPQLA